MWFHHFPRISRRARIQLKRAPLDVQRLSGMIYEREKTNVRSWVRQFVEFNGKWPLIDIPILSAVHLNLDDIIQYLDDIIQYQHSTWLFQNIRSANLRISYFACENNFISAHFSFVMIHDNHRIASQFSNLHSYMHNMDSVKCVDETHQHRLIWPCFCCASKSSHGTRTISVRRTS